MTVLLLRLKISEIFNQFKISGKNKKNVLRYMVVLFFGSVFFSNFYHFYSTWISIPGFGINIYLNFLAYLCSGMFFFFVLSSIPLMLHQNFLAKDLSFLFALPISRESIYYSKFINAIFTNFFIYILFLVPALAALVVVEIPSLFFIVLLFITSLLFLVIPTALASIISIGFVHVFQPKKAKNIMSIIVVIVFIVAWIAYQFLRISHFDPASTSFEFNSLLKYSDTRFLEYSSLLPSTWFIKIVYGYINSDLKISILNIFLMFAFAALLYYVAIKLASRFSNVYCFSQGSSEKHVTKMRGPFENKVYFSFLSKDIKLIKRDSRFMSQYFMLFAVLLVLPFIVQNDMDGFYETWVLYYPYLFISFFHHVLTVNHTMRLLPLEGRNLGIIKIIPQAGLKFVLSKISFSFFIIAALSVISSAIVAYRFNSTMELFWTAVIYLIFGSLGVSTIGVFMGFYFSKFDWNNPRQMYQAGGTLFSIIITIVFWFIGVCILAASVTYNLLFYGLIAFIIYCILVFSTGTVLSVKKLYRLDWLY